MKTKNEKLHDLIHMFREAGIPTLQLDYTLAGQPELNDQHPQVQLCGGELRVDSFAISPRGISTVYMAIFTVGLATLADSGMLTKIAKTEKWCDRLQALLDNLEQAGSKL